MKRIAYFGLLILMTNAGVYGQHPNWLNFTNGKDVNCLKNDGNFLWVGTKGGLTRLDKINGNAIYYTKTNSGLPGIDITGIDKDNQGNLWLSVRSGGVARFDGTNWVSFNEYMSPSYPINFAQSVLCHPDGSVWVGAAAGTAGGIYRYYNNIWTRFASNVTFMNGWIESLSVDTAGVIYAGSPNSGMSRFDGSSWTHYTPLNSAMLNERIHDLEVDAQNNIWASSYNCGGPGGLSKFDGTSFTTYLVNTTIKNLSFDTSGNLWFSKFPFGISRYDGTTVVNFDSTNSQITEVDADLLVDGSNIWYGTTFHNGLKKFDGVSQVSSYSLNQSGISYNYSNGISVDSNDVVWLTASNEGIDRFDQNGWTNLNSNNSSIPVPWVYSLATDPFNQLWMGSPDGVIKFDGTTFTHFDSTSYNLIGNKVIHKPVFDSFGNVYCLFRWYYDANNTRQGGGIMKYDGVNWTKINLSSIADTLIENMTVDKQDQLWATSRGKIEKYHVTNPVIFSSLNSPISQNSNFTSLFADGNNNMWLSDYNGQIYKIVNSQTFSSFNVTPCNFFPGYGDQIPSMCADKNNNIWISIYDICSNNGTVLAKFDGTSFSYFDINNCGLSSNPIQIESKGDKIYMTTNYGLVIFTDSTLSTQLTEHPGSSKNILISPNPSTGRFHITCNHLEASEYSIEVINLQGQQVFYSKNKIGTENKMTIELNLESLHDGYYFVRLVSGSSVYHSIIEILKMK